MEQRTFCFVAVQEFIFVKLWSVLLSSRVMGPEGFFLPLEHICFGIVRLIKTAAVGVVAGVFFPRRMCHIVRHTNEPKCPGFTK